jgi:hypothetical protein
VLDAIASNKDGFLLRNTSVSSAQQNMAISKKESLSSP